MKKQMVMVMEHYGDLESTTIKCGKDLLQKFETQGMEPFQPRDALRECITDIIMKLCYGHVSQEDVSKVQSLELDLSKYLAPGGIYLLLDIFRALSC